ncbi:MAG: hypothetical protein R3B09_05170 [Nannocystaceae bacterium]
MSEVEATVAVAVAAEDWGHFRSATRLADRVIAEKIEWARDLLEDDSTRESLRRWGIGDDERPWVRLKDAYRMAKERGLPCFGHFDGRPGESDAAMFRAQLLLFQAERNDGARIDAVLMIRDVDDDPRRIDGARQVLDLRWPFPVIIALPLPEIEAWLVAGYVRQSAACDEGVSDLDAKDTVDRLTDKDREREALCLEADLDVLRRRGAGCGLAAYLADVEAHLVPLFIGPT